MEPDNLIFISSALCYFSLHDKSVMTDTALVQQVEVDMAVKQQ